MDSFLGLLAGVGMLALIGILFVSFLRQIGVMKSGQVRLAARCAGIAFGAGVGYWLVGALVDQVIYNNLASISQIDAIFRGPYLQKMFSSLAAPEWFAPLSGLFCFLSHGLGRLLFGQYILAGMVLSWMLTYLSVCLLSARLQSMWDEKTAENTVFFLLCFPGALFFFLPGWASLALFLASVGFFFLGKRFRVSKPAVNDTMYAILLCISSVLSAMVVTGAVYGRLG